MATTSKTTKAPAKAKTGKVFSEEELQAMQDAKSERKKAGKTDGLADLKAALAKLNPAEKAIGEKLHEIVTANAPGLAPRTWYGMPAWADDTGKAVCFYTPASKFKERYSTFGFNAMAKLDDGNFWPTSWAITTLGDSEAKKIAALVKKAVG
jgi:uncharacterized protein YdhG (YjbR/CyaY superfamily)